MYDAIAKHLVIWELESILGKPIRASATLFWSIYKSRS